MPPPPRRPLPPSTWCLQENPDEVPAGSLPRTMEVILRNDQVQDWGRVLSSVCWVHRCPTSCRSLWCLGCSWAASGTAPQPDRPDPPPCCAPQVETVRPGDKAVFTGMLVVVPDVAALT
mgnify:CR=1 FL=1